MAKLKRFQKVHIKPIEGKVINPVTAWVYDKDNFRIPGSERIVGYRCTDGKRPAFWFVVPCHMIEECEE